MRNTLPIRLFAILTLPLAAAFAQEPAHDDAAAPSRVRSVMLAPVAPAEPLQPEAQTSRLAAQRGQIGVYLGAEDDAPGAAVRALVTGGAAESAGLQAGDRILAIDDQRVSSSAALIEAVKAKRAGDRVTLMVDRDGWRKRIAVELRPAVAQQPDAPRRQVVEELEEAESEELHLEPEHARGALELEELRKLIELHAGRPGEVHVERRVWINGEELSPEGIEELGEEDGGVEAPRRIRWRIETDEERRPEARREAQDRQQRELRMERAQRLRERQQVEQERRVEREVRLDPRAELVELRRELRQLRREIEELRRELDQRRR